VSGGGVRHRVSRRGWRHGRRPALYAAGRIPAGSML